MNETEIIDKINSIYFKITNFLYEFHSFHYQISFTNDALRNFTHIYKVGVKVLDKN